MKKTYLFVDGKSRAIVSKRRIGKRGQSYFNTQPNKRLKIIFGYLGVDCVTIGFLMGCYEWLSGAEKLSPLMVIMSSMLLPCGFIAMLVNRFAVEEPVQNKRHYGAWPDPYGLARDTADIPGKKTYYIVDSERNAVVDVIHLGKWGQKWLNRHATRRVSKIGE